MRQLHPYLYRSPVQRTKPPLMQYRILVPISHLMQYVKKHNLSKIKQDELVAPIMVKWIASLATDHIQELIQTKLYLVFAYNDLFAKDHHGCENILVVMYSNFDLKHDQPMAMQDSGAGSQRLGQSQDNDIHMQDSGERQSDGHLWDIVRRELDLKASVEPAWWLSHMDRTLHRPRLMANWDRRHPPFVSDHPSLEELMEEQCRVY